MSDSNTPAPDGAATENDQTVETTETTEGQQPAAETEVKTRDPKWYTDRIAEVTRARRDEERKRLATEMELNALKAKLPKEDQPPPKPDIDIESLVNAEITKREMQKMLGEFESAGNKEYPDFTERCNSVAALGAAERNDFMRIILDMDDGHKVVAALSDEPEEASRILKLPTHKLALELAKLASAPTTRAAVSRAPAPPRPVDGSAKSNRSDPNTWSVADHRKAILERGR